MRKNRRSKKAALRIRAKLQQAFSLVEMLVVIAVIGVIAAIAIPNISDISGSAKKGRDQRNAQNIASVYAAARASGWTPTGTGLSIADELVTGVTITNGALQGTTFKIPNLTGQELTDAKQYLTDAIEYNPNPSTAPSSP